MFYLFLEDNVFDPRRPIDLVAHTPARGVVTAGRFHTDTSIPPTLAETRAEASTETTPQVTTQVNIRGQHVQFGRSKLYNF